MGLAGIYKFAPISEEIFSPVKKFKFFFALRKVAFYTLSKYNYKLIMQVWGKYAPISGEGGHIII